MATLIRPTSKTDWTDGAAAKQVEPSAAKKLTGWVALERPPFEFMNFLFFNTDQWVKFLEQDNENIVIAGATPTAAPERSTTILVDATAANHTVNLPDATINSGVRLRVVKTDATANTVTLDAFSTQTINGALTQVINNQFTALTVISDGTEWFQIA